MTTREEIDAALACSVHRVQLHNDWMARNQPNCSPYWDDDAERLDSRKRLQDCARIAEAYLAERAERQRRIEAAAEELWRKVPGDFIDHGEIRDIITRHLGETT